LHHRVKPITNNDIEQTRSPTTTSSKTDHQQRHRANPITNNDIEQKRSPTTTTVPCTDKTSRGKSWHPDTPLKKAFFPTLQWIVGCSTFSVVWRHQRGDRVHG
jgi:hypothetical protein